MLSVQSFVNSPVPSNCYVLFDKDTSNDCINVDPGSKEETDLFTYLEEERLMPRYIILTHEHFDHCWGVNQLVEKYHIPILCSQLCSEAIKNEKWNFSVFYDNKEAFTIKSETISVESLNYVLVFNREEICFFITPGHTDASMCILTKKYLFTGDALIKDEKTVTKLPTGSLIKLKDSKKLFGTMQGKGYKVLPGHGDSFMLYGYNLNNFFEGIRNDQ